MLRACRCLVVPGKRQIQGATVVSRHFSAQPQQRDKSDATADENDATIEEINEANDRWKGEVEIRLTDDHGWGIYALKDYSPEERVMVGRALRQEPTQDSHTIQTGWDTHVFMDLPARYVNHICGTANLGIVDNEHGAYDFLALCEIAKGDELRWDYECTEYKIPSFQCTCGSPLCRRFLSGYSRNGSRVRAVYGDKYIANYLKEER